MVSHTDENIYFSTILFPISELTEETETKIEDLAFVCANCHKMIHQIRPWLKNLKILNIFYKSYNKISR